MTCNPPIYQNLQKFSKKRWFATHQYTKIAKILQKYVNFWPMKSMYQNCWQKPVPMSVAHPCIDICTTYPPPHQLLQLFIGQEFIFLTGTWTVLIYLHQQLQEFIDTHPEQGTGSRALAQAVDQTRANIRWIRDYEEEVQKWLEWAVTA